MTTGIVVRSPDVLWHRTSRRILVSLPAGATVELHGVEALVWEALAQPGTVDELVDDLAAAFDRPAPVVRADVTPLLDELVRAGAVRCS